MSETKGPVEMTALGVLNTILTGFCTGVGLLLSYLLFHALRWV